ncbi:MFS transporter [Salinifilum aidingensis]
MISWALWDWGSAAFNTIIVTFVFTVYLTDTVAPDPDSGSQGLGAALAVAGLLIAVLAPITGQRSDAGGRRKLWLGIHTGLVVASMGGLFFVRDEPSYLLLGLVLLAVGSVFFEFAQVNYNAMLVQISRRETVGRVSGFGWGMGYCGGLIALVIVLFAFIRPEVGLFGVTSEDGLNIRAVAVFSALWFAMFALPVLLFVPENPPSQDARRLSFLASYVALGKRLRDMWRTERRTLWFLGASALYRDGLAAVFTFGGVLAAGTFGFSAAEVVLFAIAANLAAGLGAITGGWLDDLLGPKRLIVSGLLALILMGIVLMVLEGKTVFWVCGLALAIFVGPTQSASRTFLARISTSARQGEAFGLYATTGRAVSFLGPLAFSGFIAVFGVQRAGIAGIVLVLALGLIALLPVRAPEHQRES